MDIGIKNTRKGMVRSSKAKITLLPGLNRVSEEQFAALKEDKMIAGLIDVGCLAVVKAPPKAEEGEPSKGRVRAPKAD